MELDQISVAGLLTATIGGGVIGVERQANTALKLTVALVVGRGPFRSVTVGVLVAMGLLITVMVLR